MMFSTHQMSRIIFLCITVFALPGCQHVRSFLHMDSNSPSPFLGLELSVDASEAQDNSERRRDRKHARTVSVATTEFESERVNPEADSITASDQQFVTTSETVENAGDLKYSLPAMDLQDGSPDAEEVGEIMSRFPGS